jgi:hypothetical protein
MMVLSIYLGFTLLLAAWLGWNMYRKLDRFDWAYNKMEIWIGFCMTLLLWPVLLLTSPKKLLSSDMRPSGGILNIDYADVIRKRAQFMENPPPCGELVRYRVPNRDGKESGAEFFFSAAAVESIANHIAHESPGIIGMRGAEKWASLRDEVIPEPTLVPEILVNFDAIAEKLIESGIGQVRCRDCNKTYPVTDLTMNTEGIIGWIYANYLCPARHSLLYREVMRLFLKRNDD